MSAMDQKPTVLFVHGAWHTNEAFGEVQQLLAKEGYGIKNVQAPSSTKNGPYVHGIDDDVEVIQNALNDVVETEAEIIMVMHSFGGVAGSSAAKGFSRKERKAKGKDGGIIRMVYISAVIAEEGESLKSIFGGSLAPWCKVIGEDTYMTSDETAREIFYNDLSEEDAKKWTAKLNKQATRSFNAPATWAAWKHIPSTYLLCGDDKAIPIEGQEMMTSKERPGANFDLVKFDKVSHSPFLSMPKETADVIRRAAGEKI